MKKFYELTNEVVSSIFQCEKDDNGTKGKGEIDLTLQSIIETGISTAIPTALFLKMQENPQEEVTIQVGPMTYGVALRNAGEASSFNPVFYLTNEKKTLKELDEFEGKLTKNIELIQSIANDITDETLIQTVIHACRLDDFDPLKKEWKEKKNDADKGVNLDTQATQLLVATHVATVLHVLASVKSADSDEAVKYVVPGEGTYTIKKKKDTWEIGFVPSKEFKQAIKNDELLETLAE